MKISNIVFWGEDSFSGIVLQSMIDNGLNIQLVVTPHYETLVYKKLENICKVHNLELLRVHDVNSVEVVKKISMIEPDLCVIAHFERLIKKDLLKIPRFGFINLHPSLLPYYRGMAPQHWPIINGEKETGVTVHYVDEGTDTGNIIVQRKITLTNDMYVSDLQKKWIPIYHEIVVDAIKLICAGADTVVQSDLKGSYYGKLKENQCYIDISGSVARAFNMVRGLSLPYMGARFGNIIIYKAHIAQNSEAFVSFKCGIYMDSIDAPFIKFHDGVLLIDKYIFK
jgi:methionyl-tRNA formyltransferase